jgi:hypothetical protein
MKLKIEIELDNAAFEGESGPEEIAWILAGIADRLPAPLTETTRGIILRDSNGNTVGSAWIEQE